jgi:hypothetical protein
MTFIGFAVIAALASLLTWAAWSGFSHWITHRYAGDFYFSGIAGFVAVILWAFFGWSLVT